MAYAQEKAQCVALSFFIPPANKDPFLRTIPAGDNSPFEKQQTSMCCMVSCNRIGHSGAKGRGDAIAWPPPLSPDITPWTFFLRGYVKHSVCQTPVHIIDDL